MRRTALVMLVGGCLASLGVLATAGVAGLSAGSGCARGSVAAKIGGKSVCLRAGLACKAGLNRDYARYGFVCTAGKLRTKPCVPGSVAARIGGRNVCLRPGIACSMSLNPDYARYGFECIGGKLDVKAKPPAPPPPSPAPGPACAALDESQVYLSEGPPNAEGRATNMRSTGTLRAAVIFVDFSDAPGTGDLRQIVDNWMRPGVEWLRTTSYGRLSVELQPATAWVRMPRPASSYGMARGLSYETHRAYIVDAIAAADPAYDFSQIDVVYIVAPPTELIPQSPTFRGRLGALSADGRQLGPAVTFGRDAYNYGRTILPHETSHLLGLPDLYAFTGDPHGFVGTWDYMGNVFTATDLLAWHRLKLGWLDGGQVACPPKGATTTVELAPLGASGGVKAAFVRTGPTTGVLVENRQRVGNDVSICDTGALVYTVDSSIPTGRGPIKVVGGSGGGCGYGQLSDAPLHPGERADVAGVGIAVTGANGTTLTVSVTVP